MLFAYLGGSQRPRTSSTCRFCAWPPSTAAGVRVVYHSLREDRAHTRTLDPLGLVEDSDRWHLVADHRGCCNEAVMR